MVDLQLIKKRRAKKIVAIVGAICGGVALIFAALSLLYRHKGPLTIVLDNSGTDLTLSRGHEPDMRGSSYLLSDTIPDFSEVAGVEILNHKVEDIDKKGSESILGDAEDKKVTKFFITTFFVKNNSEKKADYDLSFDIEREAMGPTTFDLAKVLRVRIYENLVIGDGVNDQNHNYTVYAMEQRYEDGEKEPYWDNALEFGDISHTTEYKNIPNNEAELFADNDTVCRKTVTIEGKPNEGETASNIMRYTILMYLEGNDRDSLGVDSKNVSNLSLGVHISAYASKENQENSKQDDTKNKDEVNQGSGK